MSLITVLTTVGTSLLNNFLEVNSSLRNVYDNLDKKNYSDKNAFQSEYDHLKEVVKNWLSNVNIKKSCAEIKSILKIKEYYKEDLLVKFLATDTLLSVLSTEIIIDNLKNRSKIFNLGDKFVFNDSLIIKKTDVHNNNRFKEGIQNLFDILQLNSFQGCVINFSGGYKSLIPYLTLYASICQIKLCYIYEDSEELIMIPPLHLKIDMKGMEKLEDYFIKIDQESVINYPPEIKKYENHVKELFDICVEPIEDKYTISIIGDMLWKIYSENKDVILVENDTPPEKKQINLRDDGGKDILYKFSKKLVNSPYVVSIINSLPYNPHEKEFVKEVFKDGLIELVLTNDDRGIGLKVQTTGRNFRETKKIAHILEEKYYK